MPAPDRSLSAPAACHRCLDAPRQKSHPPKTRPPSNDPALPAAHGAGVKVLEAPEHGAVLDLRTAKEQRRARERLRSMSAMQAEVPMPNPCCDAGARQTGWRHSWGDVVEFTFSNVEQEAGDQQTVPCTQIAGLALSYLCRYLTLSEDDPPTGGGGGTGGRSAGAVASGRRPAATRNRSDPGELGASTLVSIIAAFKVYGLHPPYDDHFAELWPSARLTKARPPPPHPPTPTRAPPATPRLQHSTPQPYLRLRALRPRVPVPARRPPHPAAPSASPRPCSRRTSSSWCRSSRSASSPA
jgi:hypothetical protein